MNRKLLNILEIIVAVISIIICLMASTENGYNIMFLVPSVYLVLKIIYMNNEKNSFGFVDIVLNFICFLKYAVLPIIIVYNSDYYAGVLTNEIPGKLYFKQSILFMIIECFTIFFTQFLYNKMSHKHISVASNITSKYRISVVLILFLIIGLFFLYKYPGGFFPNQLFVIDQNFTKKVIDSNYDGLIIIVFNIFKIVILLFTIQYFYFKYINKNRMIYLLGIITPIIAYLAITTETSRWSLFVPIVVLSYVLKDIWFANNKNKILFISIAILLSISLASITVYKFSWMFKDTDNINISEIVNVLTRETQEYISGPRPIAQGIEAIDFYRNEIGVHTLINDFIGSIPFISHYVDQTDRINIYYNYYLKGKNKIVSQIMPMITIGYAYFGFFFCFIFTNICIWLAKFFGNKLEKSDNLIMKYIFGYAVVWLSLCIGFNTQIVFGWFVSTFIPAIILLYFNKKISNN